jgi:polysaccharide pyruvyl transferase WcaK-like protein
MSAAAATSLEPESLCLLHAHATRYNVGDDAIVMATYRVVQEVFAPSVVRFIDVSRDPFTRPGEPITGFLPLYEYHWPRYWWRALRSLWQANAVLIGGGELIGGNTEFVGLALLAWLLGRPVVFYGIGANMRDASRLGRMYTRFVLRRCDRIMTRDEGAVKELRDLGVPGDRVTCAADVVFALEPRASGAASTGKARGKTVGVSLRSLPQGQGNVMECLPAVAGFLDRLVDQDDFRITLIPFLPGISPYEAARGIETDRDVLAACRDLMKHADRAEIYEGDLDPLRLMDLLGDCEFVLAMRLHASILALDAGVVPVALGYNPKVERVLGLFGLGANVVPLKAIESLQTLDWKRLTGLTAREAVRARLPGMRQAARLNIVATRAILTRPRSSAAAAVRMPLVVFGLTVHMAITVYQSLKWTWLRRSHDIAPALERR